jgi:hypothetical protein
LDFIEGHCLAAAPFVFAEGQQLFLAPTAPGLAVSSVFFVAVEQLGLADGQEVTLQEVGEQARGVWPEAFDPSTAPGLTSACWVLEQPITRATAQKTLTANVFFMDSVPLEKGYEDLLGRDSTAVRGAGRGDFGTF